MRLLLVYQLLALLAVNSHCANLRVLESWFGGTQAQEYVKLSGNQSTWNAIDGFTSLQRIWSGPADLAPAYQHMGSAYHAKALLDKLNSGKRIVAVGIGSSFVADGAGCWHTSVKALYDLGIIPNPNTYPQPGEPAYKLGASCKSGPGYMQAFMETINNTWPNFGHAMLNHGRGGYSLDHLVGASCLSTNVPDEVDIVLLDPATTASSAGATELLMRKYLGSKSRPLIILLSNTMNCQALEPLDKTLPDPGMLCSRDCLLLHNSTACNLLGPEPFTAKARQMIEPSLEGFQSLAVKYDVLHINLHKLLLETLLTPELCSKLNVTKWQMLARFYMDSRHFQKCHYEKFLGQMPRGSTSGLPSFPCTKALGSLLVADLLVNWLHQMQGRLAGMAKDQLSSLSYKMPPPVHEQATRVYRSRCFGISWRQLYEAIQSAASSGTDEHKKALQELNAAEPGGFFDQKGSLESNSYLSLPPLNVTKMDGFTTQLYYKGSSKYLKFKPGFVASTAGAMMEFELDTLFPEEARQLKSEVVLSYTCSYDGWGKARITCLAGCSCDPVLVDAASKAGAGKHSLLADVAVSASQHRQCRMQVQVLPETSSSGHKFKVSAVLVRIQVPMS